MDPRKHTLRHIIMTLVRIKEKERTLKAAREKETATYKGVPVGPSADFSKKPGRQEGAGKKYSKS